MRKTNIDGGVKGINYLKTTSKRNSTVDLRRDVAVTSLESGDLYSISYLVVPSLPGRLDIRKFTLKFNISLKIEYK